MKVVDMYAASLPALAISYRAIHELVKEGKTGHIFDDKDTLADLIFEILKEGTRSERLARYSANLKNGFAKERWPEHWNEVVGPLVDLIVN